MKQILDACCGGRMSWFPESRNVQSCLFGDCRAEEKTLCDGYLYRVVPDVLLDVQSLPFRDGTFSLVFYDPPHLKRAGETSWLRAKYGVLPPHWQSLLKRGFAECWRVLKPEGTLIFKWSEVHIPIRTIRTCFPAPPLFGHTTTKNMKTHWIVFFKFPELEHSHESAGLL